MKQSSNDISKKNKNPMATSDFFVGKPRLSVLRFFFRTERVDDAFSAERTRGLDEDIRVRQREEGPRERVHVVSEMTMFAVKVFGKGVRFVTERKERDVRGNGPSDFGVEGVRGCAESEHVSEDGDVLPGHGEECVDRRAYALGIRFVRAVEDGVMPLKDRAAHGREFCRLEGTARFFERYAECASDFDREKRIGEVMTSRNGKMKVDVSVGKGERSNRVNFRICGVDFVRRKRFSREDFLENRVVAVYEEFFLSHRARRCAFFVGDAVFGIEILEMRVANGRDDGEVGRGNRGEVTHLVGAFDAHFEDEDLVGLVRREHTARKSDLVVVIGFGLVDAIARFRTAAIMSLVVVLPFEPVTPMTF